MRHPHRKPVDSSSGMSALVMLHLFKRPKLAPDKPLIDCVYPPLPCSHWLIIFARSRLVQYGLGLALLRKLYCYYDDYPLAFNLE